MECYATPLNFHFFGRVLIIAVSTITLRYWRLDFNEMLLSHNVGVYAGSNRGQMVPEVKDCVMPCWLSTQWCVAIPPLLWRRYDKLSGHPIEWSTPAPYPDSSNCQWLLTYNFGLHSRHLEKQLPYLASWRPWRDSNPQPPA